MRDKFPSGDFCAPYFVHIFSNDGSSRINQVRDLIILLSNVILLSLNWLLVLVDKSECPVEMSSGVE